VPNADFIDIPPRSRRVVMEMFPGAVVTGVHRDKRSQ
jgi:hypothetical protein